MSLALSRPAELLLLLLLLAIPGGILALVVALVRRRSVYQAWPTMERIHADHEDGDPIACGFVMRAPGAYRVLYPLGVCRVSPNRLTVAVNRRGWSLPRDESRVIVEAGRLGSRLVVASGEVVIGIWPMGKALQSRLTATGWPIE